MSNWGLDDDLAEDDDALAPAAVYQAEATGRTATDVAPPPVEFERYREESTDAGDDDAAPLDGFGGRARGDDTEDEELFTMSGDRGPWTPEAGFNDATNMVRVWVDEDQVINKVRINPSWREKIKDAGALQYAFGTIFIQINNYYRPSPATIELETDQREAREPLSWDSMMKIYTEFQRLQDEFESLGPESSGSWNGQETVGHSKKNHVQITLDLHGALANIAIDPKLLEHSRVKEVSDAVIQAHRDARDRHQPATYEPGERDRIMDQLQDNRLELLAMMRRGFK